MPSPAPGETARGETLDRLRRSFAKIDPNGAGRESLGHEVASLRLGVGGLDAALQGGLAYGALHELAPAAPAQLGAALGFALTLAALAATDSRAVLVIQTDFAALEAGAPYGPGLELLGLPLQRLVLLRLPRPLDLLAAFEEALRSRAIAVVLAELAETVTAAAADLTATRRLSLAARAGGGLGLLLRYQPSALPTAATTRWEVAAALSTPDRLGGLGRTAFALSLTRNRRGRCGRFNLCWDHHERSFIAPTLSLAVAATADDGSADAWPRARAG
jgi:protein ImuA